MKSIAILVLFIMCIILAISRNNKANDYILEVVKVDYLIKENANWRKKYYSLEYDLMQSELSFRYVDRVNSNMNIDEHIKRYRLDSLVENVY